SITHNTMNKTSYGLIRVSNIIFFYDSTKTTNIYTLSLHDALPILVDEMRGRLRHASSPTRRTPAAPAAGKRNKAVVSARIAVDRSEEHTSELQSLRHLVCRLLLEKKKEDQITASPMPTVFL